MASRFLTALLVSLAVVSLVFIVPPRIASADLIGTAPVQEAPQSGLSADRQAVENTLSLTGLSSSEIRSRVDQLSPAELSALAHNRDQVQLAGGGFAPISIIAVAVILVVLLVWLETVNQKHHKEIQK